MLHHSMTTKLLSTFRLASATLLFVCFVPSASAQETGPARADTNPLAVASLQRDFEQINATVETGELTAVEKMYSGMKARWRTADVNAYANLVIKLAQSTNSFSYPAAERAHQNRLVQDMLFSLLNEDFSSMTSKARVLALSVVADTNLNGGIDKDEEGRALQIARCFILSEQDVEKERRSLDAEPVVPKVDSSKYDWGNELMVTGISSNGIKDPVLRAAYQKALDQTKNERLRFQRTRDLKNLAGMLNVSMEKFFTNLQVQSSDERAGAQKLLAAMEKSGRAYSLLQAKTIPARPAPRQGDFPG